MGRFDMLTQLDKKLAPAKKPVTTPVVSTKKHSPPPLPEKPGKQGGQGKEEQQKMTAVPEPERVPVGVRVGVPPPVPLVPKVKRVIRQRQPFDIYEDQYQRLKKIAEEEKDFENGRGMSQMVRIAIDNYLKDHDTPQE
jgi:hypothetical protein